MIKDLTKNKIKMTPKSKNIVDYTQMRTNMNTPGETKSLSRLTAKSREKLNKSIEYKSNKQNSKLRENLTEMLKESSKINRMNSPVNNSTISYSDNINQLEEMINQIKQKGFEKYRYEIEEKEREKKKYEIIIEKMQKKLGQCTKHNCIYETKHLIEINKNQNNCERYKKENYVMNKEIPAIKKEIEEMNEEYDRRVKETTQIGLLISEDNKEIKLLNDEIRKSNKKISEINKDKEQIRSAINLLKKHIDQLKTKVSQEESNTKEFLLNVSKLTKSVASEY